MKERIYKIAPHFFQQFLIALFNLKAYKVRYGASYNAFRVEFAKNRQLTLHELKEVQAKRYKLFMNKINSQSEFYNKIFENSKQFDDIDAIKSLPITSKEILRKNIDKVICKTNEKLEISKTGGTTGKSLEVKFSQANMQERFAMLDDFRSRFGYSLGKKTAWFSGKNLLTDKDVKKNRFWKTDLYHKVRYYSTFHMKDDYLKFYVENLIEFKPEYMVGFPSSILEIAKYGIKHNYNFPKNVIKAIFPTAETITPDLRETIEYFFKTKIYNQYASSEGAPFIVECENGNLHMELQSGVFEVLDHQGNETNSGRLIVTSFTTEATPLVRYDIGDSVILEAENVSCNCGNNNPLVKEILGRIDDYVYSPENGKINLGNVSNTLKDTKGIIRFQVIQDDLDELSIVTVFDDTIYNSIIEAKFLQNWRDRVGDKMTIKIQKVQEIPVEKSGKYRIVKNNIKHLI